MAGYSGTPLQKKLGIKPGMRILIRNAPDNFSDLLGELPNDLRQVKSAKQESLDYIHLFVDKEATLLKHFEKLMPLMKKDGMFWLSWPKKSSGIKLDFDGNDVRHHGLACGLVDVKVCAIDETWSGLKFMYRREDR